MRMSLYVESLNEEQYELIYQALQKVLNSEEDLSNALDSRLADLKDTIDVKAILGGQTFLRTCSACGKGMNEGYLIDDGIEYFCTDKCLFTEYGPDEYLEMYENDVAFWTEWED